MQLLAENLSITIGKAQIVSDVSLKVLDGQFVGIIGANGCGKSTLLKSIYKSIKPMPPNPVTDEPEATAEAEETSAYPVTIVNYAKVEGGTEWTKKETIYEKAPERIVATTRTAAEFLMHIGLGDKIVGVGGVIGAPDQELEEEFAKLTVLSESYIGRETALSADPDFIFGRGGLFDNADWGVGTVDSLNDMGINTFVMESSITGGDISSIYQDIDNLGKIFDVQEQANAFADTLRQKEALVVNALSAIDQEHTFGYIHSSDPENFLIYSASEESFFNSAFALLKMQNSFLGVSGDIRACSKTIKYQKGKSVRVSKRRHEVKGDAKATRADEQGVGDDRAVAAHARETRRKAKTR